MNRRQKLQDAYEDALFALLMEDVIEEEGKRLAEENEQLKNDPSAAVPEELHERCMETIHRAFGKGYKKEKRRKTGKVIYRVFSKAAAIAVICMMLFGVAYAVSPALRAKTLQLLIEVSDVDSALSIEKGDKSSANYDDSKAAQKIYSQYRYRIPKMPEGFELVENTHLNSLSVLTYRHMDNSSVAFKFVETTGGEYRIDTEDAKRIENIKIGQFDGMLIAKEDWIRIVWSDYDKNVFISVTGSGVDEDVLWDIVEPMVTSRE